MFFFKDHENIFGRDDKLHKEKWGIGKKKVIFLSFYDPNQQKERKMRVAMLQVYPQPILWSINSKEMHRSI